MAGKRKPVGRPRGANPAAAPEKPRATAKAKGTTRATPALRGYMTAARLAERSGLPSSNIRRMFDKGELNGKKEPYRGGPSGYRILVAMPSANRLLAQREAKAAMPEPEGHVTATHLAEKSGLDSFTLRKMFSEGKLDGKRDPHDYSPTHDRVLITRASAAELLREVRRARGAERNLKNAYTSPELAAAAGVESPAIRAACQSGEIKRAVKIKFKGGGKGGQWMIPKRAGDAYVARVKARAASPKPRPRPQYKKRGHLTASQLSDVLASEGLTVGKSTIRRWRVSEELPYVFMESGAYFFSRSQLPAARRLAQGLPPEEPGKTTKTRSSGRKRGPRPRRISGEEAYKKLMALRAKRDS